MVIHLRRAVKEGSSLENHLHALAIHYVHDNFVRVHKAIGGTPAMLAGLRTRPMGIEEWLARFRCRRMRSTPDRRLFPRKSPSNAGYFERLTAKARCASQ